MLSVAGSICAMISPVAGYILSKAVSGLGTLRPAIIEVTRCIFHLFIIGVYLRLHLPMK